MNQYRDEFENPDFMYDGTGQNEVCLPTQDAIEFFSDSLGANSSTSSDDKNGIDNDMDENNESQTSRGKKTNKDENTLRILVLTDTHLGYKENDEFRGNEAHNAFQEAINYAEAFDVDIIVHSGDLFDLSKPNRMTMYKAIETFREAVLYNNDGVCNNGRSGKYKGGYSYEVIGNMRDGSPCNIYEPAVNVKRPVFLIHGNHDDPNDRARLSPADILQSCRLINYFGVHYELDDLKLKPIIIRKGTTNLALYGLGNIRDERLNRACSMGNVQFLKPDMEEINDELNTENNSYSSQTDKIINNSQTDRQKLKDHFALLLVHQNRYRASSAGIPAKNCLHEHQIPSFMDLVIWGHEHDCLIEPTPAPSQDFSIIQPGSSVITSLQPAEAGRPKHVAILEVRGRKYRSLPICLWNKGVIFAFADINLHEEFQSRSNIISGSNVPNLSKLTDFIESLLHEKAKELIEWAKQQQQIRAELCRNNIKSVADCLGPVTDSNYLPDYNDCSSLPLVRLRVDHHNPNRSELDGNYPILPIARFGEAYRGKVSNYASMLLFTTKSSRKEHSKNAGGLGIADMESLVKEFDEHSNTPEAIFDMLIENHLSNKSSVLLHSSLNRSLHAFVLRGESNALSNCIENMAKGARVEALNQLRKQKVNSIEDKKGEQTTDDDIDKKNIICNDDLKNMSDLDIMKLLEGLASRHRQTSMLSRSNDEASSSIMPYDQDEDWPGLKALFISDANDKYATGNLDPDRIKTPKRRARAKTSATLS